MRAFGLTIAALALAACKTSSVTEPVKSAGEAVVEGAKSAGSAATSLVNVNLSNVLNDLAVQLNVDRANIPINAQVPITIAANVCGVSINILSVSAANQATCTAKTTSGDLAQAVQQQMSAGTTQTPSTQPPATQTPTQQPSTTQPTQPQDSSTPQ